MYINGTVHVEDQLREFLVLVPALQDLFFSVAPFAPKDTWPKHQPSKKKKIRKSNKTLVVNLALLFFKNSTNHEGRKSIRKTPLYLNYLSKHLAYFRRGNKITFCAKHIAINIESCLWVSQDFLHIFGN